MIKVGNIECSMAGVSKVMLGGDQLWPTSPLPPGYTALDYLSNHNSADANDMAYINTGVYADDIGYISSEMRYGGTPTIAIGDGSVVSGQFYFMLGIVPLNNAPRYGVQFGGGGTERVFSTAYDSGWHTIAIDVLNAKGFCDSEEVSITINNVQHVPVWLFVRYRSPAYQVPYMWGSRRRNIKIYDTSMTLIRDMIPAQNAENVSGMYDKVNGVFYTSPNGTLFDQ